MSDPIVADDIRTHILTAAALYAAAESTATGYLVTGDVASYMAARHTADQARDHLAGIVWQIPTYTYLSNN